MVRNKEKYEQAVVLRKRGFTLSEIAKYCDVSKSTVSNWLKNMAFSEAVTKQNKNRAGLENAKRLKLISKTRTNERTARRHEENRSAATEFKHYKSSPLFIAGLMFYLSNGDQTDSKQIRLSTTLQDAHTLFIRFAIEYLGVEKSKIRFWLLLYPVHKEGACMKSWKRSTSLPYSQFHKSQVLRNNSTKKPLHSGVGNTIIGGTVLRQKLDVWIALMIKELKKSKF